MAAVLAGLAFTAAAPPMWAADEHSIDDHMPTLTAPAQPVFQNLDTQRVIREIDSKLFSVRTCKIEATLVIKSESGQTLGQAEQQIWLKRPQQAKVVSTSGLKTPAELLLTYTLWTGPPLTTEPPDAASHLSPLSRYEPWMRSSIWGLRKDTIQFLRDETLGTEPTHMLQGQHGVPPIHLTIWVGTDDGLLRKVVQQDSAPNQVTPGLDELTIRSIATNIDIDDHLFVPDGQ